MLDPRVSFSPRDRGPVNRLLLAFFLTTSLVWTEFAHATTVAIVWPSTTSVDVNQTLTLLR